MTPLVPPPLSNLLPTHGSQLLLPWRVIDGDSLEMCYLVRQTFRLHGLNTPEGSNGAAATKRLRELLGKEPVAAELYGVDKYHRTLIYLPGINETLLAEGLAKPYDGRGPRP